MTEKAVKTPKPLRGSMPGVAAFVDNLRQAFGDEAVDGWVSARAIAADPEAGFHAREAGHEVGKQVQGGGKDWSPATGWAWDTTER